VVTELSLHCFGTTD